MSIERIRVGVVGANMSANDPLRHSWGARAHLPALTALPEYDVVAVCTNHMDTARATATHFGIPHAFDDVGALIDHPEVDVVDVCVAAAAHHSVALPALQAGKHVICEWPLGADGDEARSLRDAAIAAGVRHAICLQARYAPVYQYMRQLIAEGAIGQVLSCSFSGSMAVAPSPRSTSLSLIHFGHVLDTVCFVMGQEPARTASIVDIGRLANHLLVHGELDGGALFNLNIRHIPVFADGLRMEVDGSEGILIASIDGTDLPGRGIRSLGEQLNQASLRLARAGEPATVLAAPAKHRWVPPTVGTGPEFAIAQLLRRFAGALNNDSAFASDFDLAVRRHDLYATLQRQSTAGLTDIATRPSPGRGA